MKYLLYGSLVFLMIALLLAGAAFLFAKQSSQPSAMNGSRATASLFAAVSAATPTETVASLLAARAATFPQGDTITLQTSKGGVRVTNFYKSLVDTEEGSIIIRETDAYTLEYAPDSGVFSIAVYGSPFETVRLVAEQELVGVLGLQPQDACALSVKVFPENNPSLQSQVLPLSFCPGN
jgi:hypothetical protein